VPELQVAFPKKRITVSCRCCISRRKATYWGRGRTPVQRNTFYEPIKILENAPAAETTGNAARSKMLEDNLATA
jgi:hypothetical protein